MSLVALQNLGLLPNSHMLVTPLMCSRQVIASSDTVNPTFLTADSPLPFPDSEIEVWENRDRSLRDWATLSSAHGPCGRDRQHVDRVDGKKLADLVSGN